jgi:aminoglycoside phosphotransferase (APT) family kinase protein
MPERPALDWVAGVVGAGSRILAVTDLHDGLGPWWLRVEHGGTTHEVVLRVAGWILPRGIVTGAAALRFAEEQGVSAPRLLAADLGGRKAGKPATLETALPGSSALPGRVSVAQLRAAGAAIARVHAVPLTPRPGLPLRVRPTSADDRALERRWATLYRAVPEDRRPDVVDALSELTGESQGWALRVVEGAASTPLLQLADDLVREHGRPQGPTVFLHGDVWWGNTRWGSDAVPTLIDWKDAGAGDPGVDLGELRLQMVLCYGPDTIDHVLEGWREESRLETPDLPYWDAVAALNTPVRLEGWPAFDAEGNRLDVGSATARRDAFLRAALDRLGAGLPQG